MSQCSPTYPGVQSHLWARAGHGFKPHGATVREAVAFHPAAGGAASGEPPGSADGVASALPLERSAATEEAENAKLGSYRPSSPQAPGPICHLCRQVGVGGARPRGDTGASSLLPAASLPLPRLLPSSSSSLPSAPSLRAPACPILSSFALIRLNKQNAKGYGTIS